MESGETSSLIIRTKIDEDWFRNQREIRDLSGPLKGQKMSHSWIVPTRSPTESISKKKSKMTFDRRKTLIKKIVLLRRSKKESK